MFSNDDLVTALEIVVDLLIKLENTNVIPISAERELDTDVPP